MEQKTEEQQVIHEQTSEVMQEEAKETQEVKKKHKTYTAMLRLEDGEGNTTERNFSWNQLKVLGMIVGMLIIVTLFSLIYGCVVTKAVKSENAELTLRIGDMSRQNSELAVENESLQEKVLLLSETVNQKVEAEADAVEKAIPSGFPLAGITTILEDEEEETDEEAEEAQAKSVEKEPEVIFEATEGNCVIAAGSGTIISIVEDETWGRILKIDHENGYISIYKVDESPKVKKGDEITKGTLLFEITDDSEKIGYQIMQGENYIDPLGMMEISG